MEGKLGSQGFLHPDLPTIYALRNNQNNWGSSFKYYWTRFNLPNALDPIFKVNDYLKLNDELKMRYVDETKLSQANKKLIAGISSQQTKGTYLAEGN